MNWLYSNTTKYVLFAVMVLCILGGIVEYGKTEITRIRCTNAGYPVSEYILFMGGYCFKDVDGTTIQVPVEQVGSQKF